MEMSSRATPAPTERRARLGQRGEDLAARTLKNAGLTVLARNWRRRTGPVRGELDLICREGDTLVVVEVKTRRGGRFGGPLVAVTAGKQAKIRALTRAFLHAERVRASRVRFDVVGVTIDPDDPERVEVNHVRRAF